jgi:glycosyltransferase involved in cell wall biosynthesis
MKVVIIALANQGGMVHYASQLANSLSVYAETYVIVGDAANTSLFNDEVFINPIPLVSSGIIKKKLFNYRKVIEQLNIIKPDIIHITANYYWIFGYYSFLRKKNVVLTLHDVNEHIGEKYLVNQLANKLHIKVAKHIFVHGTKLQKELDLLGYPTTKTTAIAHGDYSFFAKYKLNDITEDGSILFFGRILDYKGLQYLIAAEPAIKEQIPDVNIIIAGSGDFDKYEKLIVNPESFEIINNFIEDEKVAELFQRASIVVLPYIDGSQTGIIPIAYSFKKPVITTNIGSIPEVVDDGITGYIISPRNSDALADSIIRILKDNDLRKQMGENGYLKMKEELSWDSIANKTVQIYNQILETKNENP